MFAYCVHELRLSEDSALKRIQAARTARRYPAIFDALAEGKLHLSAVVLLAPYLNTANADSLLAAATYKSKAEVEQLLAERFPGSESLALMEALPRAPMPCGRRSDAEPAEADSTKCVTESSCQHAPGHVGTPTPRSRVAPIAPERFVLQVSIGQSTRDKLRYAQELLSHEIPSGEIGEVLDRALDALVARLEKRKFAATGRPRANPKPTQSTRHIPAHVKRAVWKRDGGRCTFVAENGRRCPARRLLEFDHEDTVARGGRATVDGMRLRCHAHNQLEAERVFGTDFMRGKREEAQRAAEARRRAEEVIPFLRRLGFSADESRRAASLCETMPDASLEDRVRRALASLKPPARVVAPAAGGPMCAAVVASAG
jgi:hypothetical protein